MSLLDLRVTTYTDVIIVVRFLWFEAAPDSSVREPLLVVLLAQPAHLGTCLNGPMILAGLILIFLSASVSISSPDHSR